MKQNENIISCEVANENELLKNSFQICILFLDLFHISSILIMTLGILKEWEWERRERERNATTSNASITVNRDKYAGSLQIKCVSLFLWCSFFFSSRKYR